MKKNVLIKIVSSITLVLIIVVLGAIIILNSNGGLKAADNRSLITVSKSSTISIYVTGVGVDLVSSSSDKDIYSVEQNTDVTIQAVNESHIFTNWAIENISNLDVTKNLLGETNVSLNKTTFEMGNYDIELSCLRREPTSNDYGKYMNNRFVIDSVDKMIALQTIIAHYEEVSNDDDKAEEYDIFDAYDEFFGEVEEYKKDRIKYVNDNKLYELLDTGYFLVANNLSVFDEKFNGIGTKDHPFNGVMCGDNGQENSQVVLVITDKENTTDYYGLFAYLGDKAVVRDLKLRSSIGVTDTGTETIYAGGLAAYAKNSLLVNIDIASNISIECSGKANVYSGGFIGYSEETSVADIAELKSTRNNNSNIVTTTGNAYSGFFAGYAKNCYVKEFNMNISGLNMTTRNNNTWNNTATNRTNIYSGLMFGYIENDKRIVLEDINLTSTTGFKVDNFINGGDCYTGGIAGYVNDEASVELGSICLENEAEYESEIRSNTTDGNSQGNAYAGGIFARVLNDNVVGLSGFKNRIKVITVDDKNAYVYNPVFTGNITVEAIQNGKADGSNYGKVIAGGIVGKGYIDINGSDTNLYLEDETHLVLSKSGAFNVKATQSSLASHSTYDSTINIFDEDEDNPENVNGTSDIEHCISSSVFGIISTNADAKTISNVSIYGESVNTVSTRAIGSKGMGDIYSSCFLSYSNGTQFDNINLYFNTSELRTDSLSYVVRTKAEGKNNAFTGALAGFIGNPTNSERYVTNIYVKGVDWNDLNKELGTQMKVSAIQNTVPHGVSQRNYTGENYVGGIIGQLVKTNAHNLNYLGSEKDTDYIKMSGHENPDSSFCGGLIGFIKLNTGYPSGKIEIFDCTIENTLVLAEATNELNVDDPDMFVGGIVGAVFDHGGANTRVIVDNAKVIGSTIKAVGNEYVIAYCSGIMGSIKWSDSSSNTNPHTIQNSLVMDCNIIGNVVKTLTTNFRNESLVYAVGICTREADNQRLRYMNNAVVDTTISSTHIAAGIGGKSTSNSAWSNNYSNAVIVGQTVYGIGPGGNSNSDNYYYKEVGKTYAGGIGVGLSFARNQVTGTADIIFDDDTNGTISTAARGLEYLNYVLSYNNGYKSGVNLGGTEKTEYRIYISNEKYLSLDPVRPENDLDSYVKLDGNNGYVKTTTTRPTSGAYAEIEVNGETRYIENAQYYAYDKGLYYEWNYNGQTYYSIIAVTQNNLIPNYTSSVRINNTNYYYNTQILSRANRNATINFNGQGFVFENDNARNNFINNTDLTVNYDPDLFAKSFSYGDKTYYINPNAEDTNDFLTEDEYRALEESLNSTIEYRTDYPNEDSDGHYKIISEDKYNEVKEDANIDARAITIYNTTVSGSNNISFIGSADKYYEDVLNVWVNFKGEGDLNPLDLSKTREQLASEGWFNMGEKIIFNQTGNLSTSTDITNIKILYGYDFNEFNESRLNNDNKYEYEKLPGSYTYNVYTHANISYFKIQFIVPKDKVYHESFGSSLVPYAEYSLSTKSVVISGEEAIQYDFILYPKSDILQDGTVTLQFIEDSGVINENIFTFNFKKNIFKLIGGTYATYTPPLNYYEIKSNADVYWLASGSITKFIPVLIKSNDLENIEYVDEKYIELVTYTASNGTIKSSGEFTAPNNTATGTVELSPKDNSGLIGDTVKVNYNIDTSYDVIYSVIGMTTDCVPNASNKTNYYFPIYLDNGFAGTPTVATIKVGTGETVDIESILGKNETEGNAILYDKDGNILTKFSDDCDYYLLKIKAEYITNDLNIVIKFPLIYSVTFDLQCGSFNSSVSDEEMTKTFVLRNTESVLDFFGYDTAGVYKHKTDGTTLTPKQYEALEPKLKLEYELVNSVYYTELTDWVKKNTAFGYVFTGFYLVDNANDSISYGEKFEDVLEIPNFTLNTSLIFYARWSFLIELVEAPGTTIETSFADSFMYEISDSTLVNKTIKVPINNNRGYVFTVEKDSSFIGEAQVKAYIVTQKHEDNQVLTEIYVEKYHENMYLYFIPPEQITGYLMIVTSISNSGFIVGEHTATVTDEILPEDGVLTFKYVVNHRNSGDDISYIYDAGTVKGKDYNLNLIKDFRLRFFKQTYHMGSASEINLLSGEGTALDPRTLPNGSIVEVYYQKIVNGNIVKRIVGIANINNDTTDELLLSDFMTIDQEVDSKAFPVETFRSFLGSSEYISEVYYFVVTPPNGYNGEASNQIMNYMIEGGYVDGAGYVSGVRTTDDFVNIPLKDHEDIHKESSVQTKIYSVTPSRDTYLDDPVDSSYEYSFVDNKEYEIFKMETENAEINGGKLVLNDGVGMDTIIQTNKLPFEILGLDLVLGYGTGNINIYGGYKSGEEIIWKVVKTVNVNDIQYKEYNIEFVGESITEKFDYFKIDNISGNAIRVEDMKVYALSTGMTYEIDKFEFNPGTTDISFRGSVINDVRHDGKAFMLAVQLKDNNGEIVLDIPNTLTLQTSISGVVSAAIDVNEKGRVTAYFDLTKIIDYNNITTFDFSINVPDGYKLHAILLLEVENVTKPAMSEVREVIVIN